MKLIINILDKDYEKLKDGHIPFSILDVVQNGIPLDKMRAEIAKDLSNAEKDSRYTQDDIDCGISVGLKRALDTIDKYRGE